MARPRAFDEDRITKAIRIAPQMNEALTRIANERQVSVNLVVTWALEEYVGTAKKIDEIKRAG